MGVRSDNISVDFLGNLSAVVFRFRNCDDVFVYRSFVTDSRGEYLFRGGLDCGNFEFVRGYLGINLDAVNVVVNAVQRINFGSDVDFKFLLFTQA